MISRLIGGFVAILIGVSLIGPLATTVTENASTTNASGGTCVGYEGSAANPGCQLYLSASWGATILRMVPGFFALAILGVGIAVTYGALRDAGVV